MSPIVQVLLMLAYVVYADEEFTNKIHFDVTDHKEASKELKKPIDGESLIHVSPTADRNPEDQLAFNEDVYSYNTKKTFDRVDTYREHTDLVRNIHKPSSEDNNWRNNNKYFPGDNRANEMNNANNEYTLQKFNNNNNENGKQEHIALDDNKRLDNKKDEAETSPYLNVEEYAQSTKAPDTKIDVEGTNEYISNLFDNYRNDLSPNNIPNDIVYNSNGGAGNTVVHIDIASGTNNVHKPSQVYPFSNSPPPVNNVYIYITKSMPGVDVPSNIQIGRNTAVPSPTVPSKMKQQLTNEETNRASNGQPSPINTKEQIFVTNPLQNNQLFNNFSPSSVLIYANGQLILVPGILINPQQYVMPINNGYQAYGPVQNLRDAGFTKPGITTNDHPRADVQLQNVPTTIDPRNSNMGNDNVPVRYGYPLPYNYNNNVNTPKQGSYGVNSNGNMYMLP